MKLLGRTLIVALALVGVGASIVGTWVLAGGISARPEPGRAEAMVARRLRSLAIPRADYDRHSPVAPSREMAREGLAHFADHCAGCHSNDGSGDTQMGRGLYPRPPDMRKDATQALSDGALFYIIENGVRHTGMPAGAPARPKASWPAGTWCSSSGTCRR